ncbi:MAG TPA: hypothetical protein VF692_06380 [Pyrinomonadaceae bacterium]
MYDLNDNPISTGQIAVSGFGFGAFSVKADCRSGYILRAEAESLTITARRLGDEAWTNLITGSIDLSAFDGARETFEVRVSGSVVSARTLREARLIVEPV